MADEDMDVVCAHGALSPQPCLEASVEVRSFALANVETELFGQDSTLSTGDLGGHFLGKPTIGCDVIIGV